MLSVDAVDTGSDRFPPPFQCQCAPGHKAVGEMGTPHSGKSEDHTTLRNLYHFVSIEFIIIAIFCIILYYFVSFCIILYHFVSFCINS